MKNDHVRAIRGDVGGWSLGATRRNTEFLFSVMEPELTGTGYAVTLTLRRCPPDAATWHRLCKAWTMRMQRYGMVRLHWVTEWQRRGVPHLHCAIWWSPEMQDRHGSARLREFMTGSWCMLASEHGTSPRGQDAHLITGAVGWFQYVSKHAARGVRHYQRSPENVPEAWKMKTGRMWGKWGDWPVREKIRLLLQDQHGDGGWFAWRRLVRGWRVADARAKGDVRRVRMAKRMWHCNEQPLSRVRGVREWIPQDVTLAMLANLATRGYVVDHAADAAPPRSLFEAKEIDETVILITQNP